MNTSTKPKQKIETMTSRERVMKTIDHHPVDRMPIDLGMHYSTGISAFAYWNLREYLGLSIDSIEIVDMVQFLARVDDDILKRFHCDCMILHPGWSSTHRWNPRGKYEFVIPKTAQPRLNSEGQWIVEYDGIMRMPVGGYFFDGGWLNFEDRAEEEVIRQTAQEAERVFKETDYYTVYIGFGGYFSDHPDWLCNMILEPEQILEQNRIAVKRDIEKAREVIDSMGSHIQAVCINSDLGTQNAPFCRPSLYEELVAPFVKQFCDFIHQNSELKVFLHCCGSIKPLIPILIECGVDILNPVQVSALDMEPEKLKKEFGNNIAFWGGGCDTQNILNLGSPEDVKRNVKELINTFKPNGGFVFNQVHNILGNVHPENIVAMLDTAYQESFY